MTLVLLSATVRVRVRVFSTQRKNLLKHSSSTLHACSNRSPLGFVSVTVYYSIDTGQFSGNLLVN